MKALVVGISVEPRFIPRINAASIPGAAVSVAATKYTRLVLEGFRQHLMADCTNVLLVPIGMYPASRVLWWKSRRVNGRYYLPFVNVLLLKQLSIALGLGWFALRWCLANRGAKCVVVFTCIYLPFLAPFVLLKRIAGLKLVSFVPDLPEYQFEYSATPPSLKRVLVPVYIRATTAMCHLLDYFVFLTEAMKEKCPRRPYAVMEGFVEVDRPIGDDLGPQSVRSVMYSGALFEKYGIRKLIEAFRSLSGDYELWLFGSGEMAAHASAAAAADPRIRMFGNVSNREVLAYQRRATLLVNPRPTSEDFTRYSFPSKLLEYMSSGRPVLTTGLSGIPADYHDKLWFINEESVVGMRLALERALNLPAAELTAFGRRAEAYVRAEKNNLRRIGDLLQTLEAL